MNTCKAPNQRTRRNSFYMPNLDNIIKEMFHQTPGEVLKQKNIAYNKPAVNVIHDDKQYTLEVALPGLRKKDVSINVDKHMLIIKADVASPEANYRLREFNYSKFERQFRLPKNANLEEITAGFSKGILTIEVAKKAEITKTIEIK